MPTTARVIRTTMIAVLVAMAIQTAGAQSARTNAAAAGDQSSAFKALWAAADALGMIRWSDIGAGNTRLPGVDVVTTMEFWGSGTAGAGQGPALKTDYHAALAYNPPAMRVETTRTDSSGGNPQHAIQVVREKYAWNESEIGGGLVPGKGTATPAMDALKGRLLRLWTLPYGVVKAGVAAGDKTTVSMENGATVITFPLSGELAGITMKATLDAKNLVTKVETQTDNPALRDLATETEYSDYADHGQIPTDVKSPGHIIRKQGGRTVLDIQIKTWDANNPYLVFPVPPSLKNAPQESAASK